MAVHSFLLVATAALFLAQVGTPQDQIWPQWRGPDRDGAIRASGYPDRLVAGAVRRLWEVPIRAGYSSPSVGEGCVVVTDRVKEREQERVLCFDAFSGQQRWTFAYDAKYVDISYDSGPRAAPTIHEGKVFVLGTMAHLHCLDLATGEPIWKKDLQSLYGSRIPIWGMASAPLVYRDTVIVNVGGIDGACLVAFRLDDGSEVWRSLEDDPGYSSPIVRRFGKRDVLIFWSADALVGLDPTNGKQLWRIPFRLRMDLAVATPVVDSRRVFVSSFYDGSLMVELSEDGSEARELWRIKGRSERNTLALHCLISTPLFRGDYIYGVDSYGELRCLRAADGERLWETLEATGRARWSNAHLTANGDVVYLFNEHGELISAVLSPEGYRETGRVKLINPTQGVPYLRPVTWAHPAYAYGNVYVRNDEVLRCWRLVRGR